MKQPKFAPLDGAFKYEWRDLLTSVRLEKQMTQLRMASKTGHTVHYIDIVEQGLLDRIKVETVRTILLGYFESSLDEWLLSALRTAGLIEHSTTPEEAVAELQR